MHFQQLGINYSSITISCRNYNMKDQLESLTETSLALTAIKII